MRFARRAIELPLSGAGIRIGGPARGEITIEVATRIFDRRRCSDQDALSRTNTYEWRLGKARK
jgi:hypothetical protein